MYIYKHNNFQLLKRTVVWKFFNKFLLLNKFNTKVYD